jgi:hypothetical protein
MAWSDDMRCLYCDGKLPLYRKITHGQFCSTAHRKAYWQEQERLAVERLHQTHTSLRVQRPPSSIESILGRDPGPAELGGFVSAVLYPQSQGAPRMLVADPLAYDLEPAPGKLEWNLPEPPARGVPSGSLIRLSADWPHQAVASRGAAGNGPAGVELVSRIALPAASLPLLNLTPIGCSEDSAPATAAPVAISLFAVAPPPGTISAQPFPSRMPRPTRGLDLPIAPATPEMEPRVETPPPFAEGLFSLTGVFQLAASQARECAAPLDAAPLRTTAAEPLVPALPLPMFQNHRAVKTVGIPELAGAVPLIGVDVIGVDARVSAAATPEPVRVALPLPPRQPNPAMFPDSRVVKAVGIPELAGAVPGLGVDTRVRFVAAATPEPAEAALALSARQPNPAMFPDHELSKHRLAMPVGLSGLAGAVPLLGIKREARAARPIQAAAESVRALAPAATPEPVQAALAFPSRQPSLAMGRGSRYPIEFRANGAPDPAADPIDFPTVPADIVLPAPFQPAALAAAAARLDAIVPGLRGLLSLKAAFGTLATTQAAALRIQPIVSNVATIPQPLRTELVKASSRLEPLDEKPIADLMQLGGKAPASPGSPELKVHLWSRAAGFWKQAPRDLKILAFAIPLLLALAFHRELPKVHVATTPPSTGALRKNLKTVMNTEWTSVRQAVMDRAAVALDEDFRSGLDEWASRGDATADWSFDATGFVRPGPLALYRPSMSLTDYQVQFLGMIDKKALSWVVRAADFDNYYVIKLVVLKPGPRTTVGLTRYAVINGKAVDTVETVVPMEAQPDTLYMVRLELAGDNFSLNIQGQMVDTWSEPRLPRGGIGFFTVHGEESRIRWVAMTHQYDMLGRLCAYLAPYETPTTNGSW